MGCWNGRRLKEEEMWKKIWYEHESTVQFCTRTSVYSRGSEEADLRVELVRRQTTQRQGRAGQGRAGQDWGQVRSGQFKRFQKVGSRTLWDSSTRPPRPPPRRQYSMLKLASNFLWSPWRFAIMCHFVAGCVLSGFCPRRCASLSCTARRVYCTFARSPDLIVGCLRLSPGRRKLPDAKKRKKEPPERTQAAGSSEIQCTYSRFIGLSDPQDTHPRNVECGPMGVKRTARGSIRSKAEWHICSASWDASVISVLNRWGVKVSARRYASPRPRPTDYLLMPDN